MRRSEEIQGQLQEAIQLAQAGQRIEARRLLEAIVQADPQHELAWLWLATVSTDRDERIRFLERTLAVNPHNARAREAYAQLTGAVFTPPDTPGPPSGDDGLAEGPTPTGSPSAANVLLAVALVIVLIAAVALGIDVLSGSESASDPTRTPVPRAPTRTFGPSPTATWTPLPTDTPGPSPTSIWDAPPPTWTPAPFDTAVPTTDAPPTSTPPPTDTATARSTASATATPTATVTATSTPRPEPTASPPGNGAE